MKIKFGLLAGTDLWEENNSTDKTPIPMNAKGNKLKTFLAGLLILLILNICIAIGFLLFGA